ncbi:MAG TPA: NAD-dependent epimerase/dehydratase family protein, partial [Candidatus Deferrimicrobium sp.]
MRVAITGSTGLVGSAVVPALAGSGYDVVRLLRRAPTPGEKAIRWDPEKREIDAAALEGFDAVIHLAGENVGAGRWTAAR